jgi:hypothetical protein
MIHFTCACGKALHAKEDYAGQMTRCPQCGRDLPIPGDRAIQADVPPPREALPEGVRRDRRPHGDRDWEQRPPPPATSGMAVASTIFGVVSLLPVCSLLAGVPAIILGAVSLITIGRSEGRLKGKGLAITGLITGGLSFLMVPLLILLGTFSVGKVRESANKIASANNLKMISLGAQDYANSYGDMPNSAICDPQGKPLLSWRVAILPFIEEDSLYKQFKLDEPWDGPNNSKLIAQMPKTYALPGDTTAPPGYTYYRAFVATNNQTSGITTAFAAPRPGQPGGRTQGIHFPGGFPDGMSNTILVVEAQTAAPWTKPDELSFDPNGPLPPMGGHFSGGFQAVMADGSVHWVSSSVSQQTLRAAITANGGEVLGPDW